MSKWQWLKTPLLLNRIKFNLSKALLDQSQDIVHHWWLIKYDVMGAIRTRYTCRQWVVNGIHPLRPKVKGSFSQICFLYDCQYKYAWYPTNTISQMVCYVLSWNLHSIVTILQYMWFSHCSERDFIWPCNKVWELTCHLKGQSRSYLLNYCFFLHLI